jgi:putative heme-binding domain-containing protein
MDGRELVKIALWVLALVGAFIWSGIALTEASGGRHVPMEFGAASVEWGEALFWDRANCYTCHAVGGRGSSVRGPNLGATASRAPIGVLAESRAQEREAALGRSFSATDYLVESLVDPGAYLVEGFADEMPEAHLPPISLEPEELVSVILYLQSLGGEPDPGAIDLPPEARRPEGASVTDGWALFEGGDSIRGQALFFDEGGPAGCAQCHRVGEAGSDIGPELTAISGTRPPEFIVRAVLDPNAQISRGYETVLVETVDGRLFSGLLHEETADSLWLADSTGERIGLERARIARQATQEVSIMPDNIGELLSVQQFLDLMAYLRTLR